VLVERAVAAQIDLGDAARQRGERLLDHPAVARAGRDIAVAELVGDDDVLLGPQRQHWLIATIAVICPLGRPFVAGDHGGVDVEGGCLHWPTALQIEDQFGIGFGQTQQRH
jgi:hypothetical protein